MNSRKLVLYNPPYNAVQFEFVATGIDKSKSCTCYVQLANYKGEGIDWQRSVSLEVSMSMLIDMIAILHELNGSRNYKDIGKARNKTFKFGVAFTEKYKNALWIELNETLADNSLVLTKPKLALTIGGRLGDVISLKAFLIGALNGYLLEQTGMTYTIHDIITDLLNTPAISRLPSA